MILLTVPLGDKITDASQGSLQRGEVCRRRFTINNRVTTWRRVVDWMVNREHTTPPPSTDFCPCGGWMGGGVHSVNEGPWKDRPKVREKSILAEPSFHTLCPHPAFQKAGCNRSTESLGRLHPQQLSERVGGVCRDSPLTWKQRSPGAPPVPHAGSTG